MPVLVTDASNTLARRCAVRLLEEGGEVRAYGGGDLSVLRAAGAMVSAGTPDDEGRLEAALTDVHTLLHVGVGLLTARPEERHVDTSTMLTAALNAGVARIISLSVPGAATDAPDGLRRAKGALETALAAAPIPTIVVRTSLIDTPTVRDALVTTAPEDVDDVPVAPVTVADIVELVVAFDAARSRSTSGHLVVAADGPERMTIRDYRHAVGTAARQRAGSRVGRRLVPADATETFVAALKGPWWSDDPVLLDGWKFADIAPTSPGAGEPVEP
ncbi:MAG: hypothetical protein WD011_02510 [Nitriliruptoraceae bacterium]